MSEIVILGAGLTGISAAYHLEQKNFFDYKIFEKESQAGGLCGSVTQDGFTFDYTGHLLHINDPYFEKLIFSLMKKEEFNTINRKSYIFSNNVYTNYPYQINLHGLPTEVIADCIEGFVNKKENKSPTNFYEWALSNFGEGITKNFFVPFQSKILDFDIKKITASWTGRFVPKTTLRQMLIGALEEKKEDQSIGYNSSFYYPKKGGIYFWVKKIAERLNNKIQNNFEVEEIDTKNKIITFSNGHVQKYDILINTMPLDVTLKILKEPAGKNLGKNHKNLICNSVVNFNLGIKNRNISDKHWIYYPEHKYPFYRVGFPHNFSNSMTPKNCSSLYGEFSYTQRDSDYVKEKTEESIKKVKKVLKIDNSEIATEKIINISHGYVIYNFWRENNLKKILEQLTEYDIHSVGRYGEWKYSSMQEAVLDGKKIADQLVILPSVKEKLIPKEKQNQKTTWAQ